MKVSVIAGFGRNRVIGVDGELPWNYSEDLQHFRNTTIGSPVIMGRKTYENIWEKTGGPLADRTNIVLSTTPNDIPGVETTNDSDGIEALDTVTKVHGAGSIEESLAIAKTRSAEEVFIAGGGSIYRQFIPIADKLILSKYDDEITVEEDSVKRFPEVDDEKWEVRNIVEKDGFVIEVSDRVKQ